MKGLVVIVQDSPELAKLAAKVANPELTERVGKPIMSSCHSPRSQLNETL